MKILDCVSKFCRHCDINFENKTFLYFHFIVSNSYLVNLRMTCQISLLNIGLHPCICIYIKFQYAKLLYGER